MKSVKKRRHRQQFFKGILYKNLLYEKFQSSKENPVFTSLLVLVKCDLKIKLSIYGKKYLMLLHPSSIEVMKLNFKVHHSPDTVLSSSNKMPRDT